MLLMIQKVILSSSTKARIYAMGIASYTMLSARQYLCKNIKAEILNDLKQMYSTMVEPDKFEELHKLCCQLDEKKTIMLNQVNLLNLKQKYYQKKNLEECFLICLHLMILTMTTMMLQ